MDICDMLIFMLGPEHAFFKMSKADRIFVKNIVNKAVKYASDYKGDKELLVAMEIAKPRTTNDLIKNILKDILEKPFFGASWKISFRLIGNVEYIILSQQDKRGGEEK